MKNEDEKGNEQSCNDYPVYQKQPISLGFGIAGPWNIEIFSIDW